MIMSLFLMGGLTLLLGPAFKEYGLTEMLIGLATTAVFYAPTCLPNMAEMIVATHVAYPEYDLEHANSLLSGMFNCFFGLG